MRKPSLILVDGSYYMFRAYHAMPDLQNAEGEPTSAIFGVLKMVRSLLHEFNPDYFAIVFDAKGKTFRNDIYPEYKANRPPMPDDLRCQIKPIHELIRASGLPLLVIDDVEADDVIGTLATQADAAGIDTLISTGDKDYAQLVNERIELINTMSNTIYDPAGVQEKYGVRPDQIIDYLALMGDSVDNVPGVPKVGPKTAAKWLAEHDTLDNVIANADSFKGKVGEYLRDTLDFLPVSKELVTIKRDVELDVGPEDLVEQTPDFPLLRELFHHWNFRSWIKELDEEDAGEAQRVATEPVEEEDESFEPITERHYETIFTEAKLDELIEQLNDAELICVDTETTSLDYMQAKLVGISFAIEPGHAVYIPLNHDYPGVDTQLDTNLVLNKLKSILEDENKPKLGQHLKYDMSVFANHGITLKGIAEDSMLASYCLNSTATRHDMDSLAKFYLGRDTIHYEDICGKGAKQIGFAEVDIERASEYAAEDVDITLQLHLHLQNELNKTPTLLQVYQNLEMPLVPVLSKIERGGVLIDNDMLLQQSQQLTQSMAEIEMKAHDLAGKSFNIGSPKQIQTILYDEMNLPVLGKTSKGAPSTAESVLQELAEEYDLPQLILDYRSLSKLKSTYTDKLPEQINPDTGRVHTSYHQAVTATGRLSSSDPNLQNIPIRTEEGRKIRQAFVPPEGFVTVAADYSQIELRIMAHLSNDESLLKAFAEGADIHKATAAEVFETNIDNVEAEQRRAAKAINFGLIYGMSAFGLAKQLGIGRKQAQQYIDLYFSRYPGVKHYMDNTRIMAKEQGYVETVFKRRLYLPEINARNAARRQYAERTAINAPMQGTAADIIKMAMIAVDDWLETCKTNSTIQAKMIMQVHDELVFEVAKNDVDNATKEIKAQMESVANLSVPLVVDVGVGENWDEAH